MAFDLLSMNGEVRERAFLGEGGDNKKESKKKNFPIRSAPHRQLTCLQPMTETSDGDICLYIRMNVDACMTYLYARACIHIRYEIIIFILYMCACRMQKKKKKRDATRVCRMHVY